MTMESSYRIVRETSVYPCQQETYPRRLNAMPAPVRRTAATRPPIRPMTLPVWGSVDTGAGSVFVRFQIAYRSAPDCDTSMTSPARRLAAVAFGSWLHPWNS